MKHRYRHWISEKQKYYEFKTFKIYWAYRFLIAEQLDKEGCLDPRDKTCTRRISTNYANAYKKAFNQ